MFVVPPDIIIFPLVPFSNTELTVRSSSPPVAMFRFPTAVDVPLRRFPFV